MIVQILRVQEQSGDLAAAHEKSKASREPIFVPAPVYADDRGWSIMNQFHKVLTADGQINYSVMYPQVVKAWHRHQLQTDMWLCVRGHLKVGIHDDQTGKTWAIVIGERKTGVLIIPPPLWHGAATVADEHAGLFYYVTHAYNAAAPDEDRRAFDSVDGFPWGVQHR